MKPFRKTSFSVYLPDGTRCRGAYYPGDTRLVGIHVHGFRSSSAHNKAGFFLDHALQRGYSWANFDLPCHGSSEGRFREFRVTNALTALVEVIREFRGAPVLLLGSSMGAWLSMLAARKLAKTRSVSIAGAVLVAPAFDFFRHYFNHESAEVMHKWRRDGVRRFTDHYDNRPYQLDYAAMKDGLRHVILDRPGRWDFPVRIFHGDRDEIAPVRLSREFREMSASSDVRLCVIEGGDHTLTAQLPMVAEEVDGLFAQLKLPQAV